VGWKLLFSVEAAQALVALRADPTLAARLKAVNATLGKMQVNLRHPGLKTHVFKGKPCPHGDKLFEAYAQNNTPGAYRIFWCYMPEPAKNTLLIVAITPHP
jgi:hypothetical protein